MTISAVPVLISGIRLLRWLKNTMIFRYVLAILDNVLDIICDRIIQLDDLDIKDDYMDDEEL